MLRPDQITDVEVLRHAVALLAEEAADVGCDRCCASALCAIGEDQDEECAVTIASWAVTVAEEEPA